MKTTEKILAFITVITFVTLSVGMLVAGSSDFDNDEPEMITKIGNTFAAGGLVLSTITLIAWLIIVVRKGLREVEQKKLSSAAVYSFVFTVFPLFVSVLLKVAVETMVYYDYLSQAIFPVYSHLLYSVVSIFESPAFWITFGLTEIIMSGILLFRKKSEKIPDLN